METATPTLMFNLGPSRATGFPIRVISHKKVFKMLTGLLLNPKQHPIIPLQTLTRRKNRATTIVARASTSHTLSL